MHKYENMSFVLKTKDWITYEQFIESYIIFIYSKQVITNLLLILL